MKRRTRRRRNGIFGCDHKRVTHRTRSLVRGKLRTTSERVTITNGRRKARRCRNPVAARAPRRGQRIRSATIIPFGAARRLLGAADYARAEKGFAGFHGLKPLHVVRVRLDDGSRALTRRAVFEMGEASRLDYEPRAHSKKHKGRDGRRIVWSHRLGEHGGKKPVWVHDPKSGVTSLLGGTYRVAKQGGHGLSWMLN